MNSEEIDRCQRVNETTPLCEAKKGTDDLDDSTQDTALPLEEQRTCGMRAQTWKTLIGVAIVIGIALSWVASTQFAQSTYSPGFNAPFFTTWFSTAWMLVVFPVYVVPFLVRGKNVLLFFRDSERVFGSSGLRLMSLFTHAGPFCILWILTNYSYIRALGKIPATDVTALFSSCSAFVYVFSWIWLKQRLSFMKISAVLLSMGGIVLMAYAEGFGGANTVGVLLSVAAAVGAALYKVFFKKLVGDASAGQVSLFLSCLGFLNTFLLWPVILIFHYADYERIHWDSIPWDYLCGAGGLSLVFNFLINFGIAFTYPLFISLGTVLGIPINAVTDLIFRGKEFGLTKILAAVAIVIGFLLMLIPEWWEDKIQERICGRKKYSSEHSTVEEDAREAE